MKTVRTAQNVAKDKKTTQKLLLRTKKFMAEWWVGKWLGSLWIA